MPEPDAATAETRVSREIHLAHKQPKLSAATINQWLLDAGFAERRPGGELAPTAAGARVGSWIRLLDG